MMILTWERKTMLLSMFALIITIVHSWNVFSQFNRNRFKASSAVQSSQSHHHPQQRQQHHTILFSGRGFGNYIPKYSTPITAGGNTNNNTTTQSSPTTTDNHDNNNNNNHNHNLTAAEQLIKQLQSTNLYLIGMMGSGKSTLSQLLSKRLKYRHLDTDSIAEYMCEMPIPQFFQQKPENEQIFRNLEYQILMETSKYTRVVFATGGGIVIKPENWGVLHHGLIVYLKLLPEELYERLQKNPEEIAKRPLLASPPSIVKEDGTVVVKTPLERLQEIYEARKDRYEQADVTIEITKEMTPEETADLIINQLLDFIVKNPPQRHAWKKKRDQKIYEMAVKDINGMERSKIFEALKRMRSS